MPAEVIAMTLEVPLDEVVSRKFFVVSTEDPLSFCQGIFREHHPRALVVQDKNGKYVGMLSERSIVRGDLDPSKAKVKGVYRSAPHASPAQTISEAARLMVENDLRYLPVFDKGKLLGLVTAEGILLKVAESSLSSQLVGQLMTRQPVTVEEGDSIAKAVSTMRNEGIARLPVLKEGRVTGLVTLHDVLNLLYEPKGRMATVRGKGKGEMVKPLRDPVGSLMTSPVVTVSPDETVAAAIKEMLDRDISSLVVTGPRGELIGIVTKTDLLKPLAAAAIVRPSVKLQISIRDPEVLEELDRDRLSAMLGSFARKHEKLLKDSVISLFVKSHRAHKSGSRLVHCRMLVSGPSGQVSATGEGWGADASIRKALDNLERRVTRTKEMKDVDKFSERVLAEAFGLLD
jgi:CBS domain-containing protein